MPVEDAPAIIIWFAGLLLMLVGILMFIARAAIYRHTKEFRLPWRRGIAPLVAGLILISISMYLLGVRDELLTLWIVVGSITVVIAVIRLLRR